MKAIALLLMIAVPLFAFDECCDDYCSGWRVEADWLFWNTRKCELDYAVPVMNVGMGLQENTGAVKFIDLDYQSGFRVAAAKKCGCWDFGARYTYFRPKDSSSTQDANGDLATTRMGTSVDSVSAGSINFAEAKYEIDLDIVDIEAGYAWNCGCETTFRIFGGVKLGFIDQRLDVFYQEDAGPAAQLKDRIDLDAYGMYLGAHGRTNIWCGIDFFGDISVGTLVACIDRNHEQLGTTDLATTPLASQVSIRDSCARLIGNLNLDAGLAYDFCWCWDFSVWAGYEMHLWFNNSDFIILTQRASTTNDFGFDRHPDTLGFDGLFVRGTVRF